MVNILFIINNVFLLSLMLPFVFEQLNNFGYLLVFLLKCTDIFYCRLQVLGIFVTLNLSNINNFQLNCLLVIFFKVLSNFYKFIKKKILKTIVLKYTT